MAEEIFRLVSKTGEVKTLGIDVDAKVSEIHIFINGIDVTKTLNIDEVKIIVDKVKD